MSTKRFKELKSLSKEELQSKLREAEANLFQARMQKTTAQLKDTSSIWRVRKDIARTKMLLGQLSKNSSEVKNG